MATAAVQLYRTLQSETRRRVESSREWTASRERALASGSRWLSLLRICARIVAPFLIAAIVVICALWIAAIGGVELIVIYAAMGGMLYAKICADAHRAYMHRSTTLAGAAYEPISDAVFYSYAWSYTSRFCRNVIAGASLGTAFVVGMMFDLAWWQWPVLVALAALEGWVVAAVGTWLLLGRQRASDVVRVVSYLLLASMYFAPLACGLTLLPFDFEPPARIACLVSPTGWVCGVIRYGLIDGHAWWWSMLIPVGLLLASNRPLLRRIARRYQIRELVARPGGVFEVLDAPTESIDAFDEQPDKELDIAAHICSGTYLNRAPWRGPMERACWALLTPRQRRVAQFLVGGQPLWSRCWYVMVLLTVLVAASPALGLPKMWQLMLFYMPYFVSLVVINLCAWPVSFESVRGRGPVGGYLPVSFSNAAGCVLRLGLVQLAFYGPLVLLVSWDPTSTDWSVAEFLFGIPTLLVLPTLMLLGILHFWVLGAADRPGMLRLLGLLLLSEPIVLEADRHPVLQIGMLGYLLFCWWYLRSWHLRHDYVAGQCLEIR